MSANATMQRTVSPPLPGQELAGIPDEGRCVRILRQIRWPALQYCPYCSSKEVVNNGRHQRRYQRYLCNSCRRIFNDKTGTIFQGSRYSLRLWFSVALMLDNQMSMRQISRTLKTNYDLTFRMAKKLRNSVYQDKISRVLHE